MKITSPHGDRRHAHPYSTCKFGLECSREGVRARGCMRYARTPYRRCRDSSSRDARQSSSMASRVDGEGCRPGPSIPGRPILCQKSTLDGVSIICAVEAHHDSLACLRVKQDLAVDLAVGCLPVIVALPCRNRPISERAKPPRKILTLANVDESPVDQDRVDTGKPEIGREVERAEGASGIAVRPHIGRDLMCVLDDPARLVRLGLKYADELERVGTQPNVRYHLVLHICAFTSELPLMAVSSQKAQPPVKSSCSPILRKSQSKVTSEARAFILSMGLLWLAVPDRGQVLRRGRPSPGSTRHRRGSFALGVTGGNCEARAGRAGHERGGSDGHPLHRIPVALQLVAGGHGGPRPRNKHAITQNRATRGCGGHTVVTGLRRWLYSKDLRQGEGLVIRRSVDGVGSLEAAGKTSRGMSTERDFQLIIYEPGTDQERCQRRKRCPCSRCGGAINLRVGNWSSSTHSSRPESCPLAGAGGTDGRCGLSVPATLLCITAPMMECSRSATL
jgi:hypothetical protein